MTPSVVLVLGAGASAAMGYPVGSQLRTALIQGFHTYGGLVRDSKPGLTDYDIESFATTFRDSQMLSIDSFLARRPDMAEVGKRAIAAVLLAQEQPALLHSTENTDKWYQYFFNHIASEDWNSLDFSDYAVVTFNYDRSLEHYLGRALSAAFNMPVELVEQKLESLEVVHVYGSLGATRVGDPSYFAYGSPVAPQTIDIASSRLRVIPEGRDSDETLERSRELLHSAKRIAFLGFGFDATNLQRLRSKDTCAESSVGPQGRLFRRVVATCLGLTSGEIRRALLETRGAVPIGSPHDSGFMQSDCLSTLRATQVLQGDA